MNACAQFRAHILVVDDDFDQLRMLLEMLRHRGYRITVAFDGTQGYARALASLPDLILLDVRMPKMDGFALARLLKADQATAHIPILFLSSKADLTDRLEGLRNGGVDYIVKPYLAEEVAERINIHLELARQRIPAEAVNEAGLRAGARREAGGNRSVHQPAAYSAALSGSVAKATAHVQRAQVFPPVPVGAGRDSRPNGESALVVAARRIIFQRLAMPPRASDLAQALGVPERRLARAFEQCLGMTVSGFIRLKRMRRAEYLLSHSALSIISIAEELGFSSAANFSTAFKEYSGQAPSVFRRRSGTPAPQARASTDGSFSFTESSP